MATGFSTPTRRIPTTLHRDSVRQRETQRLQRQRRLLAQSQPQFPWELLVWGASASLALWAVTYMALLPIVTGVIPLLY